MILTFSPSVPQQLTPPRQTYDASQGSLFLFWSDHKPPNHCPWASLSFFVVLHCSKCGDSKVEGRPRSPLENLTQNTDLTMAYHPETEIQPLYFQGEKALTRNLPPEGLILPVR